METPKCSAHEDPFRSAREDVAATLRLSPEECYAKFQALMAFTDVAMRAVPVEEWRRVWRLLVRLDDPGRWWERVPGP